MTPMERAELSLEGLSIGDAFGQMFFGDEQKMLSMIELHALPAAPWYLTDDSIMALDVVETLRNNRGLIDQDYLAECFASNYRKDPHRGYGGTAHYILRSLYEGENWRTISPSVFNGRGSCGNDAAMRIAHLGAYFSNDLEILRSQAIISAEVTHNHPEGQAGAVAVARRPHGPGIIIRQLIRMTGKRC